MQCFTQLAARLPRKPSCCMRRMLRSNGFSTTFSSHQKACARHVAKVLNSTPRSMPAFRHAPGARSSENGRTAAVIFWRYLAERRLAGMEEAGPRSCRLRLHPLTAPINLRTSDRCFVYPKPAVPQHRTYAAFGRRPITIRRLSFEGGSPKNRAYSRLNCVALSYPTPNATVVVLPSPAIKRERACNSLIRFWYCSGLSAVTALKWRWKAETLSAAIDASASTRSGVVKFSLIQRIVIPIRDKAVLGAAMSRNIQPSGPCRTRYRSSRS
jgi:hypothetical protein